MSLYKNLVEIRLERTILKESTILKAKKKYSC